MTYYIQLSALQFQPLHTKGAKGDRDFRIGVGQTAHDRPLNHRARLPLQPASRASITEGNHLSPSRSLIRVLS